MFRNALIATLVLVGAGVAVPGAAYSDTKDKKIALSNSTDGDPWRQAMLKSWERVSAQAVRDGIVKETAVFPTAEKQVAEQEAQIQSLIHQGYDAIVVNAASRDGLNGVIRQACDAGIVVVSFDGIVSEPCAWRLSVDFKAMGKAQLAYLKEVMPDGGNLLEIRGLAGTAVDVLVGAEVVLAGVHGVHVCNQLLRAAVASAGFSSRLMCPHCSITTSREVAMSAAISSDRGSGVTWSWRPTITTVGTSMRTSSGRLSGRAMIAFCSRRKPSTPTSTRGCFRPSAAAARSGEPRSSVCAPWSGITPREGGRPEPPAPRARGARRRHAPRPAPAEVTRGRLHFATGSGRP